MSLEGDLSIAARILRRGAWFTRIGIRSLCSHYFPINETGNAKRLALCGQTLPSVRDDDPSWRCRACERRLAALTPAPEAPRKYAS